MIDPEIILNTIVVSHNQIKPYPEVFQITCNFTYSFLFLRALHVDWFGL